MCIYIYIFFLKKRFYWHHNKVKSSPIWEPQTSLTLQHTHLSTGRIQSANSLTPAEVFLCFCQISAFEVIDTQVKWKIVDFLRKVIFIFNCYLNDVFYYNNMTKEIFSWDTHYLAFTLVLRMRLTWVRKIPDLQTIQDRLPRSCMGPVTSYRLRWGGGESEEQEGAEVGGFWGWMACFSGESGKLYSEITKSSDSPHPPFPSGNKQDRFFNRKLWCVHRPLLYGISETFPYSTIFICLFQCDCASIKWPVLV